MKRFVWRLQRVLEIRQKQLQVKRSELFRVTQRVAVARTTLLAQERILQDAIQQVANAKPRSRLKQQELLIKCSETNDRSIKKLKDKIAKLESEQREKMADFIRTKRFVEALEKLRDAKRREFIAQQDKLEQKQMDERTGAEFARKAISTSSGKLRPVL